MKKTSPAVAVFALIALGACGGSGSDSDSSAADAGSAAVDTPECSEVWRVGVTLDLDTYAGCDEGDGTTLGFETSGCYDEDSNYIGQVASYKDERWVVQAGTSDQTGMGGTPGKVTDVEPAC